MTLLDIVLSAKILVTGAALVLPLLLLPIPKLAGRLGVGEDSGVVLRLYGVAVLALLAGYASGFSAFAGGRFPWGVVVMGIVSNGGAALALMLTGAWQRQKAAGILLSLLALALVFCVLNPERAIAAL